MGKLTFQSYYDLIESYFQTLVLPSSRERRVGAQAHAPAVLQQIRAEFDDIARLAHIGQLQPQRTVDYLTEIALELTSLLFSVGAQHEVWRRWAALSALGQLLLGRRFKAAQFATVAGEWTLLTALPPLGVQSQQSSDIVLQALIEKKSPVFSKDHLDREDTAWLTLAHSIPARNHRQTEQSLQAIATYWMAESDMDWLNFHPRSYPDFHVPACSVAAIARQSGFVATALTPDQYLFLEAGLAEPEPQPLVPDQVFLDDLNSEDEESAP